MEKDNRTHRLLGELIRRMEKNDYQPTYLSLATKIHPWYKYPYYKFLDFGIEQVRALFEKIGPNGDKVFMGIVGEFEPTRLSHEDLYRIKNFYKLGEYKEPISYGRIIFNVILALGSFATIIGVLDNRQAPILKNRIDTQQQKLDSLIKESEQYLKALLLTRDSLEICKQKIGNDSLVLLSLKVDKRTKRQ